MEKKLTREDSIKEVNEGICKSIDLWATVALESEVGLWAVDLEYNPQDLMNSIYLFQHIASNIGIKNGTINEDNVVEFGKRLRQLVFDMTGYLPEEILRKKK